MAMASRLIGIRYLKLEKARSRDDEMVAEFHAAVPLLSACIGDLSSLYIDGKLDALYIQDCVSFLAQVSGKERDRKVGLYGRMLYFWLLLELMLNKNEPNPGRVIHYCVGECQEAKEDDRNVGTRLQQFLGAVWQGFQSRTNRNSDVFKEINSHNFLELAKPPVHAGSWYTLHLEGVITVLRNTLGLRFSCQEIHKLSRVHKGKFVPGRAYFYSTSQNPFPPLEPIDESLLGSSYKTERKNCIYIEQCFFREQIDEMDRPQQSANDELYKQIKVVRGDESYNFWDAVTSYKWEGYGALTQCTLANYCSIAKPRDLEECEENAALLRYNAAQGAAPLLELYSMASLRDIYVGRLVDDDDDDLPPALRWDPFCYAYTDVQPMPLNPFKGVRGGCRLPRRAPSVSTPERRPMSESDDSEASLMPTHTASSDSEPATPRKRSRFINDEASEDEEVSTYVLAHFR